MSSKRFSFKSSKLTNAADQLWSASKSGFKADEINIKLDLGKTLRKDKTDKSDVDSTKVCSSSSNTDGFIFGSKLSEKVIVSTSKDKQDIEKNGTAIVSTSGTTSEATIAGSSEIRSDIPKSVTEVFEEIKQKGASSSFISSHRTKQSVVESEAALASSSTPVKDDKVITSSDKDASDPPKLNVVTGEEGEINIHRTMCKLHSFDNTTKKWKECGVSSLRINELGEEPPYTYRIVGRVTGNQRVVLNSQIFPDMIVEKISTKRLKFSATTPDSDVPGLFLATASEYITEQLYHILFRIVEEKKREVMQKRKRKVSDTAPEGSDSESDIPKKVTTKS